MVVIATALCLAYILGLLLTAIPGTFAGIPLGAIMMLTASVVVAGLIRRIWRAAPRAGVWLTAGLVGMAAVLYFQLRFPQPSRADICHWVWQEPTELTQPNPNCPASALATAAVKKFQVEGKVLTAPRLTRSNRLQFQLAATQIRGFSAKGMLPSQATAGKVYVTVPLATGEQLYPGLTVQITGSLYKPQPATTPGGFDFANYLAQQGSFTGLNGEQIAYPTQTKPRPDLFWTIRQRIMQVQAFGLAQPEAALLSAMVLGKGAVDVPYALQDQFKQVGLAHALAASGTQVSLLIAVVLTLTQRCASSVRLAVGTGILILYLGLTGAEPSVLRAGVMGFVSLLALTADRKVKPVGLLLLTATAMLLFNPLWIRDLGFQLSFLATLGLMVTVPILTQWLDWMPSLLVPAFAVPIAAYIWTLPLLLGMFGVVSPYSILINIIASPLVAIISIGGMISAVGALIYPALGSFLAWLLYYPTYGLIKIAEVGSQLPGTNFAVGTIDWTQVLMLYGLIGLVWQWRRLQRYWWLVTLLGIGLVAVPTGYAASRLTQVTVLNTESPVLIVQDQGKTGLMHSANPQEAKFTVLPFLQTQGINSLDWAIAPNLQASERDAWQQILAAKPVSLFYSSSGSVTQTSQPSGVPDQALKQQVQKQGVALPLATSHQLQFGSTTITHTLTKPDIWLLRMHDQTWLWLDGVPSKQRQTDLMPQLTAVDVLGWSGKALSLQLLERVNPKAAIVYGKAIDPDTAQWLTQHQTQIYLLRQAGALQCSPQKPLAALEPIS